MMKTNMDNIPLRGAWNKSFANNWEEALVSGNGRQGVMVFGNPKRETLIGNHSRLFLPTGTGQPLPKMSPYLDEVRQIIREKDYDAAAKFFYEKAKEIGYQGLQMSDPFHPGFHLHIESTVNKVDKYKRSVNFETGEIAVSFCDEENTQHHRNTFISRTDDVIVHSIENNRRNVSCTLKFENYEHDLIEHKRQISSTTAHLYHTYLKGNGGYQVGIRLIAPKGSIRVHGDSIHIENVEKLLLLMKIEVFKESERDKRLLLKELENLSPAYEILVQDHIKVHQEIFGRVTLHLANNEDRKKSVEDLIAEAKTKGILPYALIEKMYDAGRFMFICSAGELSPNLQGIWTGTFKPAWSGDYTFDTNVQLSIAAALSSNLIEGIHGFFRLIKELLPGFRENAEYYYGCRGIMTTAHSSNSGRHFHWNDEWPLQFWTCGAGWLGHWFYQYYLYTGDKEFLKNETIPYLKECALFYEDFLIEDDDGTYRFTPSYSAENGCGDNSTQDIAVAREVLTNLIQSYEELNMDSPEVIKWENMLQKLPSYKINDEGVLQEWSIEGKEENYNHRHFSHLYSIFQSHEFTAESEPALWNASELALDKRLEAWLRNDNADTSSSHGRMHAALCAIQFNRKDLVYEILQMMVENDAMYSSMITSHYNNQEVFNVDANGAIPQIINEMLVDAVPGSIILLRALPNQLSKGSIQGVLLPKQIRVQDLTWDLGKREIILVVTSEIDQIVSIKAPLFHNLKIKQATGCKTLQEQHSLTVFFNEGVQSSLEFSI